MYTVAVVGPIHEEGMKLFHARSDIQASVLQDLSPEGIAKGVTGVDAITIRTQRLPKETLALAPGLRVVSRHGVGYDNVDVAYLSSRKIPMAIAVDANYTAVAEHTLMMMLCLAKDAEAGDRAVRNGDFNWRNKGTLTDLTGKHVLILGFGRIGRRVAALCRAFDMHVSAYDPYVAESSLPGVDMVKDWKALLPAVDFLSLHLPSIPETLGMIGNNELAAMKNSVFIINCARGGIIDEDALAEALGKGNIRGAGIDVFQNEPHDHTHPLFSQKRCIFSPHNAALSVECAIRMATQCAQNVLDCLDG
ncbi:MAG: hydroxyacid dehydrogenase, partial [Desulfovibrionaceae bacterium]|nr:hydroxyacid dehydrogenase [Desulfovibrionaceae bacterium]